ncbi:MAG: hypothetical protein M1839_008328 [Geoglossum umbratile]|nr:MAG: hypothetical protein M1839_008328 [Geoglossum umbratile]
MSLLPPSEGNEYLDQKGMIDAIQQHAKSNGYAVTVHRSSIKDGTVYLGCDRGGTYRPRHGISQFAEMSKITFGPSKFEIPTTTMSHRSIQLHIQFIDTYLSLFELRFGTCLLLVLHHERLLQP